MLFINDLPTAISECNILLYADDAVIYAAHKDIKILEETLNDRDWMKWINGLSVIFFLSTKEKQNL